MSTCDVIKVVVPSPESLAVCQGQSNSVYKCSETGCSFTAASASLLGLHKAKQHNIFTEARKGVTVHYHCPAEGCYYNETFKRSFKKLDELRTHYAKLHAEKKFSCQECDKKFGLERDCRRHEKVCNKVFKCHECSQECRTLSALDWHCKKSGHKKLPRKNQLKRKPINARNGTSEWKELQNRPRKLIPILPKGVPLNLGNNVDEITKTSRTIPIIAPTNIPPTLVPGRNAYLTSGNVCDRGIQSTQVRLASTGIQTSLLYGQKKARRIAQTQTKSSILGNTKKKLSVNKICKETQKSADWCFTENKSKSVSNSEVQTCVNYNLTNGILSPMFTIKLQNQTKQSNIASSSPLIPDSFSNVSSTMSTQTNFTCLLNQLQTIDDKSFGSRNQHTQTNSPFQFLSENNIIYNYNSEISPQSMLTSPRCSNQVTQTIFQDTVANKNIQTINPDVFFANMQTQTSNSYNKTTNDNIFKINSSNDVASSFHDVTNSLEYSHVDNTESFDENIAIIAEPSENVDGSNISTQTLDLLTADITTQTIDNINIETQTDKWLEQIIEGMQTDPHDCKMADSGTQIDLIDMFEKQAHATSSQDNCTQIDFSDLTDDLLYCDNYNSNLFEQTKSQLQNYPVNYSFDNQQKSVKFESETQTLDDSLFQETNINSILSYIENTDIQLETSETQTSDFYNNLDKNIAGLDQRYLNLQTDGKSTETAECQTSFEDLLSFVQNSETQTNESLTFTSSIQTQTNTDAQTTDFLSQADYFDFIGDPS